jgi:hypothetical protein
MEGIAVWQSRLGTHGAYLLLFGQIDKALVRMRPDLAASLPFGHEATGSADPPQAYKSFVFNVIWQNKRFGAAIALINNNLCLRPGFGPYVVVASCQFGKPGIPAGASKANAAVSSTN